MGSTSGRRAGRKAPVGDWQGRAACRGQLGVMFPDSNQAAIAAALAVCRPCPVKAECLTYAQEAPVEFDGVWGGYTAEDRARIRRGESVRRVKVADR